MAAIKCVVLLVSLLPCCPGVRTTQYNPEGVLNSGTGAEPHAAHRQIMLPKRLVAGGSQSLLEFKASGHNMEDAVNLAFERGCVTDTAAKFAALTGKYNLVDNAGALPMNLTEDEETLLGQKNLTEALEVRWAMEDTHAVHKKDVKTTRMLKTSKLFVNNLGFSLKGAKAVCKDTMGKPLPDYVEKCLSEVAERGVSRVRGGLSAFFFKGASEKKLKRNASLVSGDGDHEDLYYYLKKQQQLERDLVLLKNVSFKKLRRSSVVKSVISKLNSELKQTNHAIKNGWGFSVVHTTAFCEKEHKDDSLAADAEIIAHFTKEFNNATEMVDGQCIVKDGKMCPEGTSPKHVREFQKKRAALTYGTSFAVFKPVAVTLGFVIGMLAAGPAGAATGVALAAVPGPAFILPLPIAALAGVPWFGECRCFPNACEFNEAFNSCEMTVSGKSSNDFEWLPYSGEKCAPVPSSDAEQAPCALQSCREKDVEPPTSQAGVIGTVGTVPGVGGEPSGVMNCLSSDGRPRHTFALMPTLPHLGSNTPEARATLYKRMPIMLPPSASGSKPVGPSGGPGTA